jgi:hypothetical protein
MKELGIGFSQYGGLWMQHLMEMEVSNERDGTWKRMGGDMHRVE